MASPRPVRRSALPPAAAAVVLVLTVTAALVGLAVVPAPDGPAGAVSRSTLARADVGPPAAPGSTAARPPAASAPVAAPSTPATASPTSPASSAPPAAAVRPAGPAHDTVWAAAPTRFRFTGPGFTASARVCHMWDALALDPPGDPDTTVCWVRNNFGEAPGSNSQTSYILGHSFANDPGTALGRLSRLASAQLVKARTVYRDGVPTRPITVLNGSTLTLWTANGRLDYKVRQAYGVPKPQFGLVQNIVDDTVGRRVVLVTCSVHGDQDLDYNVIVDAYLYSSTAT